MTDSARRQLLKSIGLSLVYLTKGCGAGEGYKKTDSSMFKHIKEYDLIGLHRTGSEEDRATLDWLSGVVNGLGITAQRIPYQFRRVASFNTYIEAFGSRIEGIPLFDSNIEQPVSLTGTLGAPRDNADIALLKVPPHYALPGGSALMDLRRQGSHRGILAVTDAGDIGIKSGLTPINADTYQQPFGPPVIQVPNSELLSEALKPSKQTPVAFSCQVNHMPGESENLIVELPGQETTLPPLVVMTPLTGWWHCASERGGGIAIWLDLLARAVKKPRRRPVVFVATTGHELGHYGLKQLLRLPRFAEVYAWLHLGSAFCGYEAFLQLQASDAWLAELAVVEMGKVNVAPDLTYTLPELPVGEVAEVIKAGTRYLSLSGFNPWFHHPDDRWWESVDPERTLAIAAVFRSWFDLLMKR